MPNILTKVHNRVHEKETVAAAVRYETQVGFHGQ